MKHHVHLFAVVRVKVCRIEADTQIESIRKAEKQTDLYDIFAHLEQRRGENQEARTVIEFAEEISHYLVDQADPDDPDYSHSRWYHAAPANASRIIPMPPIQPSINPTIQPCIL